MTSTLICDSFAIHLRCEKRYFTAPGAPRGALKAGANAIASPTASPCVTHVSTVNAALGAGVYGSVAPRIQPPTTQRITP